MSFETCPRI